MAGRRELPRTDAGAAVPLADGVIPGGVANTPPSAPPEPPQDARTTQAGASPRGAADAAQDPPQALEGEKPARPVGRVIELPPLPGVPPAEETRWNHWLSAAAGKLAKSIERMRADTNAWEQAVADARRAGMDELAIIAAAMRARVHVPEPGDGAPAP